MSRRVPWEVRRKRVLAETHRRIGVARNDLRRRGFRLLPREARFEFLCGHVGCEKPFGHAGAHGARPAEVST